MGVVGVGIYTFPGSDYVELECTDGQVVSGIYGVPCMTNPACFNDTAIPCEWSGCSCVDYCSFRGG